MVGREDSNLRPPAPKGMGGGCKSRLFPTACDLRHWRQAIETCGALFETGALDSYNHLHSFGGPSAETKAVATPAVKKEGERSMKRAGQRGEDQSGQLSNGRRGRKTRRRGAGDGA